MPAPFYFFARGKITHVYGGEDYEYILVKLNINYSIRTIICVYYGGLRLLQPPLFFS